MLYKVANWALFCAWRFANCTLTETTTPLASQSSREEEDEEEEEGAKKSFKNFQNRICQFWDSKFLRHWWNFVTSQNLIGEKFWSSWGFAEQISKSPSRRGLQWNHAQLQKMGFFMIKSKKSLSFFYCILIHSSCLFIKCRIFG